jgi:hypothetical protein
MNGADAFDLRRLQGLRRSRRSGAEKSDDATQAAVDLAIPPRSS